MPDQWPLVFRVKLPSGRLDALFHGFETLIQGVVTLSDENNPLGPRDACSYKVRDTDKAAFAVLAMFTSGLRIG